MTVLLTGISVHVVRFDYKNPRDLPNKNKSRIHNNYLSAIAGLNFLL
jgi:hypothetical protein